MNDTTVISNDSAVQPRQQWCDRARYFNSGNAFALSLPPVPSVQFTAERDQAFDAASPTGLIDMDLSDTLQTPFPATTPLVLSRYMRIRAGESLSPDLRASAQLLCVLAGQGTSRIGDEQTQWNVGDVMMLPGRCDAVHTANVDSVIWLTTDEPALAFLGLDAADQSLTPRHPVHYLAADLEGELEAVYAHPDRDTFAGYAVVLSNEALIQTRNIHPTMTLALNSLPAGTAQKPHRHNSMALTLCLQGDDCYSLIDGTRKDWDQHAVMVTPPGAVHSHHNDGSGRMRCLIVQDGALHYHTRTMGFSVD
jgi:quercetin dioxygenase-like cupin family protein